MGLKLEEVPVPTEVLVVDSVNRVPSPDPAGASDALPVIPLPTEFEVADVKLADPALLRPMRFQMLPSGRFTAESLPMRFLISRAFNTNNNDQLPGLPSWVDTVRVSIVAKAPADSSVGPVTDPETLATMLRALLVERFGLAYHSEPRQVAAYSLVAAKPKLKKADPESRIFCRMAPPSPNSLPNSQTLSCQNAPIAMLAERLQTMPGINAPVEDATGLEGGWDFSLNFNPVPFAMLGPRAAADAGQNGPSASDPTGGYTIFGSIERQLGLKLEAKKKMAPVVVIDRIQPKPTEN